MQWSEMERRQVLCVTLPDVGRKLPEARPRDRRHKHSILEVSTSRIRRTRWLIRNEEERSDSRPRSHERPSSTVQQEIKHEGAWGGVVWGVAWQGKMSRLIQGLLSHKSREWNG